jgi:hypothetical protein
LQVSLGGHGSIRPQRHPLQGFLLQRSDCIILVILSLATSITMRSDPGDPMVTPDESTIPAS